MKSTSVHLLSALIDSGAVNLNANVLLYALKYPGKLNVYLVISKKVLGGSAVMDIGIYTLQFAQFIFKEVPRKVTALGELNEDGVDLVDTVVLEYEGERRAVLNINSKLKLWNKATVVGTKGYATVCNCIIDVHKALCIFQEKKTKEKKNKKNRKN